MKSITRTLSFLTRSNASDVAIKQPRAFVIRPYVHCRRRTVSMSMFSSTSSAINAATGNRSDADADDCNVLLRLTILRHGQTTANAAGIIQGQQAHWPLSEVGTSQARAGHQEFIRMAAAAAEKDADGGEKNSSMINEKEDIPIADPYFWRVYSSDLLRAKHTAEIALGLDTTALGLNQFALPEITPPSTHSTSSSMLCDAKLRVDPRLREFALGVREGRSLNLNWKEAEAKWRKERMKAENDSGDIEDMESLPLRETVEDVRKRTLSFIHDLITDTKKESQALGAKARGMRMGENLPLNVLLASHGGCIKVLLESALGFSPDKVGKLQNGSLTQVEILTEYPRERLLLGDEDIAFDAQRGWWYRLGPRVNDVSHMEGQSFTMKQKSHCLDSLYGTLGDDASAAAEKGG